MPSKAEAFNSETYMLWLTGSLLLVIWIIAKFLLHKSGMVHLLLMAAVTLFVVQFAQDWRTREYRRSRDS
jgi:glucose-6-phosphate-specific signal transduction histidine kinase